MSFQSNNKITACCCFDRGEVRLDVNFEKNVFVMGEEARAMYRADTTRFKDKLE